MSVCRRPRKVQINGFALFRRKVQFEMKQQRSYLTEAELNDLTAQRWEEFNETQRNEWKMRAKQEKMKGRAEKVAAAFEDHNRRLDVDDDDFDWCNDEAKNADQINVVRMSSDSSTAGAAVVVRRTKSFSASPTNGGGGNLPSCIFRPAAAVPKAKPPLPPVVQHQNLTLDPAPGPLSPIASLPPTSTNSFKQQPPPSLNGFGRGKGPVLLEPLPPPLALLLSAPAVKKTKERSAGVESYLKYIDELENRVNPDKRRQSSRLSFFSSFTWQYEADKESKHKT